MIEDRKRVLRFLRKIGGKGFKFVERMEKQVVKGWFLREEEEDGGWIVEEGEGSFDGNGVLLTKRKVVS